MSSLKNIVLEVGKNFIVPGNVLFQTADVVDPRDTMKSCLNHLAHKFINTNPQIRRLKQSCRNADGTYKCPCCLNPSVKHLTGAHIGERVSSLIDKVLAENAQESDICVIWPRLVELHRTHPVIIACTKCNSRVDDTIIDNIERRRRTKTKEKVVVKVKKAKAKFTAKGSSRGKIRVQKFIVEEIQEKKNEDGEIMYLVKWEGYDDSESTWEPRANLIKDVPGLVRNYEMQNTTQPRSFMQMLSKLSGMSI